MTSRAQVSPFQRRVQGRYHWSGSVEEPSHLLTPAEHRALVSTRTKTPPPSIGVRRPAAPQADDGVYRGASLYTAGSISTVADRLRRQALSSSTSAVPGEQTHAGPIADDTWMRSVLKRHLPSFQQGDEEAERTAIERRSTSTTLVIPVVSTPTEHAADSWSHSPNRPNVIGVGDYIAAQAAAASRTPKRIQRGLGESEFRERQRAALIEASRSHTNDDFVLAVGAVVDRNRATTSSEHDLLRAQQVRVSDSRRGSSLVGTSRHHSASASSLPATIPVSLSPRVRLKSPSRQPSRESVPSTPKRGTTPSPSRVPSRCNTFISPASIQAEAQSPHQPMLSTTTRRMLSSPTRAKSPTDSRPPPRPLGSPQIRGWVSESTLRQASHAHPADKLLPTTPRPTTPVKPYVQPSSQTPPACGGSIPQRSVLDEERRLQHTPQVVASRPRTVVSKEALVLAKKRLLFGVDLQVSARSSTPGYYNTPAAPSTANASPHRSLSLSEPYKNAPANEAASTIDSAFDNDPPTALFTDPHHSAPPQPLPHGLEAAKRRLQLHNELQTELRHISNVGEPGDRKHVEGSEAAAFAVFGLAWRRDLELVTRAQEVAAQRDAEVRAAKARWAEQRRGDQRRSCWEQQSAMRAALEDQASTFHSRIMRSFLSGVRLVESVVAPEVAVRQMVELREAQDLRKILSLKTLCESTLFRVASGEQASRPHPVTSPRRVWSESSVPSDLSARLSPPRPTARAATILSLPPTSPALETSAEVSLGNITHISSEITEEGDLSHPPITTLDHDAAMLVVGDSDEGSIPHDSVNRSRGMSGCDGAAADLFEIRTADSDPVIQRFLASSVGATEMGRVLADQGQVHAVLRNRYHELITCEVCHEFGEMFTDAWAGAQVVGASPLLPARRRLGYDYDLLRQVVPPTGTFMPFEHTFAPVASSLTSSAGEIGPPPVNEVSRSAVVNAVCGVALEQFVRSEVSRLVMRAVEAQAIDDEGASEKPTAEQGAPS